MTDWKSKLAAYLHDPPSKCLDISTHGERSDAAFRQAGITDPTEIGVYFQCADHTGAAADRLPFPRSQPAGIQCAFDGVRNRFHHPLAGEHPLGFHAEFKSVEQGADWEQAVQPVLTEEGLKELADDDERWRARFFAHWRLWPQHAAMRDYRFALFPADTRIPDHSIWTHMQVVSALAGCAPDGALEPAFLKFHLGPVQDFIAAARSIRDLWSGSYLLSWLMAAGLKALSATIGPDAVIFPNLRGQPIFDLHWRDALWRKVRIGSKNVWEESLNADPNDRLTPNLPNVFLAIVPANRAHEMARVVKQAIDDEWQAIANAVWMHCEDSGLTAHEGNFTSAQRHARFDAQVRGFLSLSWRATPWPKTLEAALALANGFADGMPIVEAQQRVQTVVDMAQQHLPLDHRDGRFYVGGPNGPREKLNNIGLGWSIVLALNSWELDAVRQTRSFAGSTGGWEVGTFSNKDALTGREEAVAGGDRWFKKCRDLGGPWPKRFKKPHWLAAPTLVKRLWDIAYLKPQWGLEVQKSPNTRGIAAHDPSAADPLNHDEDEAAAIEDIPSSEKYFAVLAFDGDEIGKWISGEKTPPFATQLAGYPDHEGQVPQGALEYFERESDPDDRGTLKERFTSFVNSPRPLSPSYHLQFSEALSNFALLCARPIVEAYDGRLIYAGGDDVVALLPSDTALACAQSLRRAFQGSSVEHPTKGQIFHSPSPGFLHSRGKDDHGRPIPFLVPGPKADASVGIAIAHFKAPLQDVVRAAQAAERRAKRDRNQGGLGRKAVAVTLMKRSGEIIEWGARWSGGLDLYHAMAAALQAGRLSNKFPHRFAELLEAYVTDTTPLVRERQSMKPVADFPVDDVIRRELAHCLGRQRGPKFGDDPGLSDRLQAALATYLGTLTDTSHQTDQAHQQHETTLRCVIGLCQTVAFANRTYSAPEADPEPKGNA